MGIVWGKADLNAFLQMPHCRMGSPSKINCSHYIMTAGFHAREAVERTTPVGNAALVVPIFQTVGCHRVRCSKRIWCVNTKTNAGNQSPAFRCCFFVELYNLWNGKSFSMCFIVTLLKGKINRFGKKIGDNFTLLVIVWHRISILRIWFWNKPSNSPSIFFNFMD